MVAAKAGHARRNDVDSQLIHSQRRNAADRRDPEIEGGLLRGSGELKAGNHAGKPVQESMRRRGSQSSKAEAWLMTLREHVSCEGQKEAETD